MRFIQGCNFHMIYIMHVNRILMYNALHFHAWWSEWEISTSLPHFKLGTFYNQLSAQISLWPWPFTKRFYVLQNYSLKLWTFFVPLKHHSGWRAMDLMSKSASVFENEKLQNFHFNNIYSNNSMIILRFLNTKFELCMSHKSF